MYLHMYKKYHFYLILYIYVTSRNLSSQSILRMSTVFWTRARVFIVCRVWRLRGRCVDDKLTDSKL